MHGTTNIKFTDKDIMVQINYINQISTDALKILLKHHFINTICHSDMFQPSKGYSQGVRLIRLSSKANKVISFCWPCY